MLSKRKLITAPFSAQQIDSLNHYQVGVNIFCGHPFTCPRRSESHHGAEGWDTGLLVATDTGWVCPHCGYTQDWAVENMVKPSIVPSEETWRDFGVSIQHVNLLLLEYTEKAIAQYLALYQSHQPAKADGAEDKNEKTARVCRVVPFMLSSLRRKRLQLMGVTVGLAPHPAITVVDESWIELEKHTPQLGVEVQVLWQAPVPTVADVPSGGITSNPLHDGYGCNAWIDTRKIAGASFLSGGGFATHWRPAQALRHSVWNLTRKIQCSSRARWGLWATRCELSTNPRGGCLTT